jgi:ribosomal protein S12 methylthiotransferase accessory factor
VNRLREAGLDLVAVDLTTPDVARRGMTVARAVVPGAQPIGFGRTGLRLGGPRLYQAPVRMGYMASEPTEASLNPDPHCYP